MTEDRVQKTDNRENLKEQKAEIKKYEGEGE